MVMGVFDVVLQKDPTGGEWYSDYVYTALGKGYIGQNYADAVNSKITRYELADLIVSVSGWTLPAGSTSQSFFADTNNTNVAILYDKGITKGVNKSGKYYYSGSSSLIRSELSAFLYRALYSELTKEAQEKAPYFGLSKDITYTKEASTYDQAINNILFNYLVGDYDMVFYYRDYDLTQKSYEWYNSFFGDLNYKSLAYGDLAGLFTNAWGDLNMDGGCISLVIHEVPASMSFEKLADQQDLGLDFAKNLVAQYHANGKIKDGMTDLEKAKVYYNYLRSLPWHDSNPDGIYGVFNAQFDTIYSCFITHDESCAGRAAGFQMLMNLEGIKCMGVRGECPGGGHVIAAADLDGTIYYVDWLADVLSTSETANQFQPDPGSLDYAKSVLEAK
jgi:hypothetical protein